MRVRTHTNPFTINHRFNPLTLDNNLPLDIEIGFGKGVFFIDWSKKNLNHQVIGIEVRKNMVQQLETKLTKETLPNAKIFHGNGYIFIEDAIQNHSIDRLFIFHPDPWFKKRHHKRRVINAKLLTLLNNKIKTNGKIYISTDVDTLFEDINDQFKPFEQFKKINDPFWNENYKTHWSSFSAKDNRNCFVQAYQKIN